MSLSLSSGPVKLDTSGNGDELQHYDQVCAISQAAINKGFVKLFEKQPLAARSIHWSNEDVFDGQLVATMLPPQIELDVESGDSSKFTLQLRFDQGRIFLGQNTYQTIDGWVIAFTPLSFADCLNTTIADLAAAASVEDTEDNVVFRSDRPTKLCPGEYSIHRLFAAIADLPWGSIIWERSYMMQPSRQKLSLEQWAKDPANNALYNEVQQCLREWTLENKLASCFTQGMLLKVPKAKVSSGKVTFASRALRLQNYPYIDEERQSLLTKNKQVMKGVNGSPYNCLCFCEVVGSRVDLPVTKLLPFTGNLAGPSKGTSGEYLGTFILDRRLVFGQTQLLSPLQDLCVAMQTIPFEPEARIGGSYLTSGRRLRVVGNTADLTAGKPYRWEQLKDDTGASTRMLAGIAGRKTRTTSMAKITLEAGPQMTALKISGEYGYTCRTEYSSLVISDIASWTVTISVRGSQDTVGNLAVLNSPKAILEGCTIEKDPYTGLDIIIPNDFSTNLTGTPSDPKWVLIRSAMKVNIGRALSKLSSDLKFLQGINKFMYGGNGEFIFGPTMLNEDLGAFATINFSPEESRVDWPTLETKGAGDNICAEKYTSDTSVTTLHPRLNWTSPVNAYNSAAQTIDLTLTFSNSSNDGIAFKSIAVVCLKMKGLEGKTLFDTGLDHWNVKESSVQSVKPWSFTTEKMSQTLDLRASIIDAGLQLNILPAVLGTAHDGTNLPSKFIVPSKGSFTLKLKGPVHTKSGAGLYVLQLDEVWAGIRAIKPMEGRATTFLVLELKADSQNPTPYTVTQAEADEKRGVSHD
ncbi:uncharacterized protein Bfra_004213 [Botrytis fragariae]|uniref:Uncharacterized protein n=1 Tax=Botrytis fragariae TaxID=1964551 RepID=A0A8H6AV36_9HELO|nr:uncharacterized protein Bfra_004213 [Botrytis fragariae]KAF5874207.1 hypothetical protein Bfra_004213 [Botrytis fragariae]